MKFGQLILKKMVKTVVVTSWNKGDLLLRKRKGCREGERGEEVKRK